MKKKVSYRSSEFLIDNVKENQMINDIGITVDDIIKLNNKLKSQKCPHNKLSIDEKSARIDYLRKDINGFYGIVVCNAVCLECGLISNVGFNEYDKSKEYERDGKETTWSKIK